MMMKTTMQILTIVSLAACLASAIFYFLGRTTYGGYTSSFMIFSVVYFVAATIWAESKT